MHVDMKILYIGNDEDMQNKLNSLLTESCTCDAKRFCYFETLMHEQIKQDVLNDYKKRHDMKLPKCMKK